jgi:hypothetical protein
MSDKEYKRKHYQENKDKYKTSYKEFIKRNPWYHSFRDARRRCEDPRTQNYSSYGGRGIKFLLTHLECAALWERDKAYTMECPSIDRIDHDGHHEVTNCRFIEFYENINRRWQDREVVAVPETQDWEE